MLRFSNSKKQPKNVTPMAFAAVPQRGHSSRQEADYNLSQIITNTVSGTLATADLKSASHPPGTE